MININDIQKLITLVKTAGVMSIDLQKQGLKVIKKQDGSVVTNADKDIEVMLVDGIKNYLKNTDIIIAEEMVADGIAPKIQNGEAHWSIDPIDSTSSYINKKEFFCINIAYIKNNVPVFGLIYAPQTKTLWYGVVGLGCFKQIADNETIPIECRLVPKTGAILVSSDEQKTDPTIIEDLGIVQDIKIPSAIKLAYVAEGIADYYVRKQNKACDWDLASGIALILAAKGSVKYLDNDNFLYGQPPYLSPSLLATGRYK